MTTKIGSLSVLALALIFGLSTFTFSQGEKKSTAKTGKKTEQTQPVVKNKAPEKKATTLASKDSKTGHKKHNKSSKKNKTM